MKYVYKASTMMMAIIGGSLLTIEPIIAQIIGIIFLIVGASFYQLLSWCFKEPPHA